jgi:chemotaxis family two-component system response regulator PixH
MMSGRPKVMVIDNSASICLFIATTLQQAGYEVDIALTGQDGLAKTVSFRPQCLILDVLLPDISGYAVCRRVRESFSEQMVRILLMSTKDAPLDKLYGLRQGADRYLPKPLTTETLLQEVWKIIPEAFRSAVLATVASTPQPHLFPTLLDFIPRRMFDQEIMRVSSPFVNVATIKDEQMRRLYNAINGKKTVTELAIVTGMEMKETFKFLCVLLRENRIQIYDSAGRLVENTLFLSAL